MCIAYIRKHSFPTNTKERSISINSTDAEFKNIVTRNVKSETVQKKKKVTFSEDPPQVVCTLTPSSTQTLEEKASSHWQPDDYERFKGTARIIATEIFTSSLSQPKNPHSYDAVLTKVLQFCASSSELEEESSTDSSPVPPDLFASLAHWVRAGKSRRGLEKFSIPRKCYTLNHNLLFVELIFYLLLLVSTSRFRSYAM